MRIKVEEMSNPLLVENKTSKNIFSSHNEASVNGKILGVVQSEILNILQNSDEYGKTLLEPPESNFISDTLCERTNPEFMSRLN